MMCLIKPTYVFLLYIYYLSKWQFCVNLNQAFCCWLYISSFIHKSNVMVLLLKTGISSLRQERSIIFIKGNNGLSILYLLQMYYCKNISVFYSINLSVDLTLIILGGGGVGDGGKLSHATHLVKSVRVLSIITLHCFN